MSVIDKDLPDMSDDALDARERYYLRLQRERPMTRVEFARLNAILAELVRRGREGL